PRKVDRQTSAQSRGLVRVQVSVLCLSWLRSDCYPVQVPARTPNARQPLIGARHPMLGQVIRDIFEALWNKNKLDKADEHAKQIAKANPLEEYFYNNPGRGACKWHHYFEIYHRHFAKFRGQSPIVVEIGVAFGGSLPMWHQYFGPG